EHDGVAVAGEVGFPEAEVGQADERVQVAAVGVDPVDRPGVPGQDPTAVAADIRPTEVVAVGKADDLARRAGPVGIDGVEVTGGRAVGVIDVDGPVTAGTELEVMGVVQDHGGDLVIDQRPHDVALGRQGGAPVGFVTAPGDGFAGLVPAVPLHHVDLDFAIPV